MHETGEKEQVVVLCCVIVEHSPHVQNPLFNIYLQVFLCCCSPHVHNLFFSHICRQHTWKQTSSDFSSSFFFAFKCLMMALQHLSAVSFIDIKTESFLSQRKTVGFIFIALTKRVSTPFWAILRRLGNNWRQNHPQKTISIVQLKIATNILKYLTLSNLFVTHVYTVFLL